MEISEKGGQVLIDTHAPGLAGEVTVDALRFIDEKDGKLSVRSTKTEEAPTLFSALAERLGMLPDNQVRVLICVEGLERRPFSEACEPDAACIRREFTRPEFRS